MTANLNFTTASDRPVAVQSSGHVSPLAKRVIDSTISVMPGKEVKIYTVTQVNTLIKVALQEKLPPRLKISGEISDFKHHSSGHCYFSLKDAGSILPCLMWSSKFKSVKFAPENGMAILATGHIDVYHPGGKYQLYVEKLEPAGVGALQLAFEQMVERLQAQGLFADVHKQPIPPYPMRIGIVTSESGAAVMDIAESVYNRWPCVKLFLYPVPVQGESASIQIAAAIRNINSRNKELALDILIVGRGGGSLEDLWAFNEEVLARAVFDSKIPIISAVGHQVDTTIADLVADARASTPTKAGVIAVPDIKEVLERIITLQKRLNMDIKNKLSIHTQNTDRILASAVFKNPLWILNNAAQQADEISIRLAAAAKDIFAHIRQRLTTALEAVLRIEPHRLLGQKSLALNELANASNAAVKNVFIKNKLQLTAMENRLATLNPKSVLNRGYSITTNKKTGKLVSNTEDVKAGDLIITELAKKELIESKVTGK